MAKGLDHVDRQSAAIDSEVERELQRVRRYESAVREKPISTLRLAYDPEKG